MILQPALGIRQRVVLQMTVNEELAVIVVSKLLGQTR